MAQTQTAQGQFLNSQTDILVVFHKRTQSLLLRGQKNMIIPSRKKLIISVCGYLKFFAFQCQLDHKKLLNFFFASVFSNCAFRLTAVP